MYRILSAMTAFVSFFFLIVINDPALGESLEDAWCRALAVDYELESSQLSTEAARRTVCSAKGERWFNAKSGASYIALDNPVAFNMDMTLPLPSGNVDLPMHFDVTQKQMWVAGVQMYQPICTFGRIQSAIDAACSEVSAAQKDEQRVGLDICSRVAKSYIDILRAKKNVEVACASVISLESHRRDVKNLLDHGVVVRNDYLAVQVALANAQQQELHLLNRLQLARSIYNRHLVRPLDYMVELEELSEPMGSFDLDHLSSQAIVCRPELALLTAKVRAKRKMAQSTRAANYPQIGFQGASDYIQNRNLENESINSVSFVGQWNFFDGGQNRYKADALDRQSQALMRNRAEVASYIQLQVRQAWLELDTTRRRIKVNRDALVQSEENLKVAKSRYSQGAGTNTEVLDAVTLRTRTFMNYHGSVYDAVGAMMDLRRAVGDFCLGAVETSTALPLAEDETFSEMRRLPALAPMPPIVAPLDNQ
jgi:outer membrane protein